MSTALRAGIPGIVAGLGIGYANSKLLADKTNTVKALAAGGVSLITAYLLRRRPVTAVAAIAGVAGATAATWGTKAAGGDVVADPNTPEGQKQIGALMRTPRMNGIVGQRQRMPALNDMPIGGRDYSRNVPQLF